MSKNAESPIWFNAEQALAWALQAYYAACKEIQPPQGEDPNTWASKGDFLHTFHAALTNRLNLAAFTNGDIEPPASASEQLGWPLQFELSPPETRGNNATNPERAT